MQPVYLDLTKILGPDAPKLSRYNSDSTRLEEWQWRRLDTGEVIEEIDMPFELRQAIQKMCRVGETLD